MQWPVLLKQLIEECWHHIPSSRLSFTSIPTRLEVLQQSGAIAQLIEQRQRAEADNNDGGVTERALSQQLLHMADFFVDIDADAADAADGSSVSVRASAVAKFEQQSHSYAQTRFVSDFEHHYSTVDRSQADYAITSADDLQTAMARMSGSMSIGAGAGAGAGASGGGCKVNGKMLEVMRDMVDGVNAASHDRMQAGAMMAALLEHGNRKKMDEMYEAAHEYLYYVELNDDTLTKEVTNTVDSNIRTFAQYMNVCDQTHPDRTTRLAILGEMIHFACKWSDRPEGQVDRIDVFVTHAVSVE
jgi:hypothetical protein